jgi:hypothetical protein
MIRAYYTLKLRSFCFFYWTIGDWSADCLYLTTTACVLPKTLAKSADLPRTQAGWPLVIRAKAECMTAVSSLPNHFLNFDGVLWQIRETGFKSRAPLFEKS